MLNRLLSYYFFGLKQTSVLSLLVSHILSLELGHYLQFSLRGKGKSVIQAHVLQVWIGCLEAFFGYCISETF